MDLGWVIKYFIFCFGWCFYQWAKLSNFV
jgi:hypothetical protein